MIRIDALGPVTTIEATLLKEIPVGSSYAHVVYSLVNNFGIDKKLLELIRHDKPIKLPVSKSNQHEYSYFRVRLANDEIVTNETKVMVFIAGYFYFGKDDELLNLSVEKVYEEKGTKGK